MRVPVFYLSIPKSTAASEEMQVNPGMDSETKRGPEVSASRPRHLFMNALIIQLFRLNRERL